MFKTISDIQNKPIRFIKDFLQNCTVEEKIDAYYLTIFIISKNDLAFYKSNGKMLSRTDLILNEMWQNMINDWLHFRLVNEDWFNDHIGYKINIFYLPSEKPILTEYKKDVRYIISSIEYHDTNVSDYYDKMKDLAMLDKFNIKFKSYLSLKEYDESELEKSINDNNIEEYIESLIITDGDNTYAVDEPEGYVFKWGKKNKYQIIKKPLEERIKMAAQQQTQYEFMLMDFIKFYNQRNDADELFETSYIKTVCNLFNAYITEYEKLNCQIADNVEPDSLQNPYVGQRFDVCYSNIPNQTTIDLCKEDVLYKNIFKILLVNLKKIKIVDKDYMLMTSKSVSEWNNIVRCILNIAVFD